MKEIPEEKQFDTMLTHTGVFHADDVMCAAMAKAINPDVVIKRVRDVPEDLDNKTVVVDIGYGKYDHHQAGADAQRASCGLFFDDYKNYLFETETMQKSFNDNTLRPIEIQDNGGTRNPLSMYFSHMNPEWDSDQSQDECFNKAVNVALDLIQQEQSRERSVERAHDIVQDAIDHAENHVAVLSQFAPWQNFVCPSDVELVVFPSNRGGYNVQTVPIESGGKTSKVQLPEEWLKTSPEGCHFVHQGRFLASFDSLEQAVNAAKSVTIEFDKTRKNEKTDPDIGNR